MTNSPRPSQPPSQKPDATKPAEPPAANPPASGGFAGIVADVKSGGRFFSLKFKLMGARLRARSAGQHEGALQRDLGRAAWQKCPGLSVPPATDSLAEIDKQIREAQQKIEECQKAASGLEADKTRQEQARATELEVCDKDIHGVQSAVDSISSRRASVERGRSKAQQAIAGLERELQTLKAPPPPTPSAPAAGPGTPAPSGPSPEEIARKIANAEERLREAQGRLASFSDQLVSVDRELAPQQQKLRLVSDARQAAAGRHDVEVTKLTNALNIQRAQITTIQGQIAAYDNAKAPLYVDLGRRMEAERLQAEVLKEEFARLDEARGQAGQAEAEVRAFESAAAAITGRARWLFVGAVAVPVGLLMMSIVAFIVIVAIVAGGGSSDDPAIRNAKQTFVAACPELVASLERMQSIAKEIDDTAALFREPGRPGDPGEDKQHLGALRTDLEWMDTGLGWFQFKDLGQEMRESALEINRMDPRVGPRQPFSPRSEEFDKFGARFSKMLDLLQSLVPQEQSHTATKSEMLKAIEASGGTSRKLHADGSTLWKTLYEEYPRLRALVGTRIQDERNPAKRKAYEDLETFLEQNTKGPVMAGRPWKGPPKDSLGGVIVWTEKLLTLVSATGDPELAKLTAEMSRLLKRTQGQWTERKQAVAKVVGWARAEKDALEAKRKQWSEAHQTFWSNWEKLLAACNALRQEEERRMPPRQGLTRVAGTTYKIAGDEYYLASGGKSRIVVVTAEYRDLFIDRRRDDPSRQHVHGHFRYVCDKQGVNALGGIINAQVYEVDPTFADGLRKSKAWYQANKTLLGLAARIPETNLEYLLPLLKELQAGSK